MTHRRPFQTLPFCDSVILWETFFHCEGGWHRLPTDAVEAQSMEILKSHLDAALGNWLWVTLLEQGVGPDDLQVPSNHNHPVIL